MSFTLSEREHDEYRTMEMKEAYGGIFISDFLLFLVKISNITSVRCGKKKNRY